MVDISVIIVSWNAKDLLDKCLMSIYKNTKNCTFEIILIDNASTDGSPELVEEKYPAVKVIRNAENLGFAKANNMGIMRSGGRYVCLINSDAIALEGCLEGMCKHMDENPDIGVLGPKVFNADGSLQLTCRQFPTLWRNICRALAFDKFFPKSALLGSHFLTSRSHDKAQEVDYLSGCFMMARRRAIDQVGLLDDGFFFYAEDKDWCKRFWDCQWKVEYFPDAEAIHYLYGSSSSEPVRFYLLEIKANLRYYNKHHTSLAKAGFISITLLHQMVRIIGSSFNYIIKPSRRASSKINIKRSFACLLWLMHGADI